MDGKETVVRAAGVTDEWLWARSSEHYSNASRAEQTVQSKPELYREAQTTLGDIFRELRDRRMAAFEAETIKPAGLQAFEGGATRTQQNVRLDLTPLESMLALGRRLAMGAAKHGENNWRGGGEDFRKATLSHLLLHVYDYLENGNANEANTDAIICNAAFLCEFEKRNPYKPREEA